MYPAGELAVLRQLLFYNVYIFVWIQHGCLANTVFTLDPKNHKEVLLYDCWECFTLTGQDLYIRFWQILMSDF